MTAANPPAIEALLAEFASGADERAEAAAHQLAAQGNAALAALTALLTGPAAIGDDKRWWAARTLALLDAPESEGLLLGLLADADPALRACAIAGLGERGTEAAAPALGDLLADPSPYLARLAGDALARLGRPAVGALTIALQDPHSAQKRAQAARALGLIKAPETIPALFHALEDESALVQYWADEALDRLGVGMVYFKA